jgi:hypothetical protein
MAMDASGSPLGGDSWSIHSEVEAYLFTDGR